MLPLEEFENHDSLNTIEKRVTTSMQVSIVSLLRDKHAEFFKEVVVVVEISSQKAIKLFEDGTSSLWF